MPVYSYHCHKCDEVFDLRRPMSESGEGAMCPTGHQGAKRQLSTFVSGGAATQISPPADSSPWTGSSGCCGGGCHSH
ncbi:MAG TPA: FmdB family transcriptional regulator [Acidimicrobiaceae bacterium]|nr:FmdB family transcriptional regulator [Acidimicrobiaceae bacterium]HAX04387.1 FmdB family transcriptional regulator [Acidimicrobiaceae bacterium]